jgi:hypothetical protein
MQTVVVPHDVSSFEVICEACLANAGTDGAVARFVAGTLEPGTRTGVAFCPVGHAVEVLQVEQGTAAAGLMGHAA